MDERSLQELTQWLQGQAVQKRAKAAAERVELQHLNADGSFAPLGSYPLAALTELELADVSATVYREAAEHAEHFPTPQDYSVVLHWPNKDSSPRSGAAKMLRMQGAPIGQLTPTEAPTMAGQVQQMMRHNEAQMRINAQLVSGTTKLMADELARKDARIATLEAERVAAFEALEGIALAQHERQIDALKVERSQKRLDDGLQTLKLLGGPIVAAISTKLGVPMVSADPQLGNVKLWLKSLTGAQLAQVLATSTPAQQVAIMSAYKSLALADEPGFAELAADNPEPAQKETLQ